MHFVVSAAGTGEYHLPLRQPGKMLGILSRFVRAKPEARKVSENFVEYYRPVLHWSPVLGANLAAMIAAHEKNLQQAMAQYGTVSCLHAHVTYPAGWVAMVLSEKYSIPYIITEHTGPFPVQGRHFIRNGKLTQWLTRPLEKASTAIAVSPSLADRMTSFGLSRPDIIPNFVDDRCFTVSPFPAGEPFTFLTVAAMLESKGIGDLLQTLAMLLEWGVEFRHIMVGHGPSLKQFRLMARRLNLQSKIQWFGVANRDQVAGLFAQCHAFVLPSHYESFGIVFAEAIACGRPVIATRCGGPESIVNEKNGMLVDIRNVGALAEAMATMMRNIDSYDPEDIRNDFVSRFSRQVVGAQLRKVYEHVGSRVSQ
jgi:glycosyltransferase involved in cell wall biosynthesis